MLAKELVSFFKSSNLPKKEVKVISCLLQEIIKDPFEKNTKLCKKLGLTKQELKHYISIIQHLESAQKTLKFSFPRHYSFFRDRILSGGFWEKVFDNKNPFPIEVEIHPSELCNLRCQFCPTLGNDYNNQDYYNQMKKLTENRNVVISKIQSIFTELAAGGTKTVIFSGGKEPTLSHLIMELIQSAKKAGLYVKITTNGSGFMIPYKCGGRKISGEGTFKFYASNLDRIHLSLNAHNRVLFNKMKGLSHDSKIFNRIISNIQKIILYRDKLRKKDKPSVEIYTAVVIDRDNYKQLSDIILFLARLGVDIISINRYQYQMLGKKDVFSDDEMKKILELLEKIKMKWKSKKTKLIVSVEDFRNDYYNHILRLKTKCWISYCEIAFNPVFLGLVCDTAAFPSRETLGKIDFKLGNIFDFSDFKSYWNHNYNVRKNIWSDKCLDCRFCHKLTNVYVNKLWNDYKDGFRLKDQPFYPALLHTRP